MADARSSMESAVIPLRVADPERGVPRQRSWRSPVDTGRLGGLSLLRTRGLAHYVELGKRSGAARRAKRKPKQPVCRVETRLTPEELLLLKQTSRRLGVSQGMMVRSCLLSGLAALGEE